MKRVATIDCGTNTVLLLIADWDGTSLRSVEDHAEIVRLGEGLDRTQVLSPAAMARTLEVLKKYIDRFRACECVDIRAVATESVRKAQNSNEFVARANLLLSSVGGKLDVIDGKREAALAFGAVRASFVDLVPPMTVIDIGGGSTEILVGGETIEESVSFPIGSVRLHERLLHHDPPTSEERASLSLTIDETFRHAPKLRGTIVGIAGTVTTLAAMVQRLETYDPERVHGAQLSSRELGEMTEQLWQLPLAERKKLPGLHPERADVILAGAVILQKLLNGKDCIVSDRGVRWGLAYEMVGKRSRSPVRAP